MVFDHDGNEVGRHQLEHEQILPRAGWVEHDPLEIWERTKTVIGSCLTSLHLTAADIDSIGITNQRETTVVWDKDTGRPYTNAIVWQDTRTDSIVKALDADGRGDVIRQRSGLVPAPYFSGGKVQWMLENVDGLRGAADRGDALFGTVDSWLVWNLTGGPNGGRHVTDVTNASRTMLMDLETLQWDDELLGFFGIPRAMLPEIRPSSDPRLYGHTANRGPWNGEIPIGGALGDQHAATVGQVCFAPGRRQEHLRHRQLHAPQHRRGARPVASRAADDRRLPARGRQAGVCVGGLDRGHRVGGPVAARPAGADPARPRTSRRFARQVEDNGGIYFVPAFSGLFAPYWRSDARGAIVGLSRFNTSAHLARATLEAICYQTRDVADAMCEDSAEAGRPMDLRVLKVDGGVTANDLCMQIQADVLGVEVSRPVVAETTALGAAYAAGLATGFWRDTDELAANWHESRRWTPQWSDDQREAGYAGWRKAVERTFDWVEIS